MRLFEIFVLRAGLGLAVTGARLASAAADLTVFGSRLTDLALAMKGARIRQDGRVQDWGSWIQEVRRLARGEVRS